MKKKATFRKMKDYEKKNGTGRSASDGVTSGLS
jgi:hypothetical protein